MGKPIYPHFTKLGGNKPLYPKIPLVLRCKNRVSPKIWIYAAKITQSFATKNQLNHFSITAKIYYVP